MPIRSMQPDGLFSMYASGVPYGTSQWANGSPVWMVRDASGIITVRVGATAASATVVYTFAGAQAGTFYADSSFYAQGSKATMRFAPPAGTASGSGPLPLGGTNVTATPQADGSALFEKTSGGWGWNAEGVSAQGLSGPFELKFVLGAGNPSNIAAGVSRNPSASASYDTIDFAFSMQPDGLFSMYASGVPYGTSQWANGSPVWMVRDAAGIITVRVGATAASATVVYTFAGAQTGTFYADSSFYAQGSKATMRFAPPAGTGGTTEFLYDGDELIGEYVSGALTARYVHGNGEDDPLLWYDAAGTRRSLFADHQGSIVAITDASGNPVAINAYDAWGFPNAGNVGRFGYTGQAWLPELGMWYYKARIYSPTLGSNPLEPPGDGVDVVDGGRQSGNGFAGASSRDHARSLHVP